MAVVVTLLLSTNVFALTWQEVLSQAGGHSNEIKSAQKQLDAFRWTYYKSFTNFLPQVSANLSAGETFAPSTSNSYSYGLSANQSLFKGFSNLNTVRSTAVNYDYYSENLRNAEADFYYQVRLAYIDLYIAGQNAAVQEKIRRSREENARMIKLFYNRGTEDKGSYLRTDAQLAQADYSVAAAQRELELAQLKLAQLIETTVGTAEGELQVGTASPADIDDLLKSSPSYLLYKDQLDLAEINQQSTISEFLPSVSLNGSYQKTGSSWPPSSSSKSLTLNVSMPLFPGGSNFIDRTINNYLLDKAREDFAKNQKDLYYNIKSAYDNLQDALEAYNVQKTVLTASQERARIAQSQYLNGLTTYNDWDLIQNEYISNQSSFLNYNKAALAAEAAWYKSYGGWIR